MVSLFLLLLGKLAWLYLLIALGWIAGAVVRVPREPVANLLLYTLSPIVVFEGAATVPLSSAALSLPLFFLVLCSVLCGVLYAVARTLWKDGTSNLAAFASADGNTGYFGIPVAVALLGERFLGFIVLGSLGFLLYESTVGFFVLARGNYSVRESVLKMLRLPLLYAFIAGIVFQLCRGSLPEGAVSLLGNIRGAYSVLGMMVIGLGLTGMRSSALDPRLLSFTAVAKFLVWPVTVFLLLRLDTQWFGFFTADMRQAMLLLSLVPLAVNTVILSTVLGVQPQKASAAVFVSTLLALPVIPLAAALLL